MYRLRTSRSTGHDPKGFLGYVPAVQTIGAQFVLGLNVACYGWP